MPPRQQPRSIARELALLSIGQIKTNSSKLAQQDLNDLILGAVRTLSAEVQDILETASAETQRSEERLLSSQTRTSDLDSAKLMVSDAVKLTQKAINRLGAALEIPEFIQLSSQEKVKDYAIAIISAVKENRQDIEEYINNVLVAWQLNRLPKIDQDILRISVAEMLYLELPIRVAIDEAVQLAKRYSDDEGFRFINGVLRKVSDRIKEDKLPVKP